LVIRRSLILAASLALGLSAASASPIFLRGGSPSGGATGSASACDGASTGVCADFADGQTFVQWPDVLNTGVTDYTKRYRVYRSTAALNSGNCTSGTLIGKYHLPNSGQLIGGNPDNFGGSTYTQANRQANNSSNPMAKIPDAATGGGALKQLAYATGLQVYKAAATQSAYYCVVSTNTTDASPSYIGAVGPIAESTATQQAVLYAHRSAGRAPLPARPPGADRFVHAGFGFVRRRPAEQPARRLLVMVWRYQRKLAGRTAAHVLHYTRTRTEPIPTRHCPAARWFSTSLTKCGIRSGRVRWSRIISASA
jgi:hypothetical protein